jgi:16S rRNA (cytidine1402-2'-O)-methyltransferase
MLDILGEIRQVSIARELTKIHETILRMSLKEANLAAKTDPNLSKGEIVIILEGVDKKFSDFDIKLDELFKYLREDISLKNFSKAFSKVSSYSAKEIYNRYKEKV